MTDRPERVSLRTPRNRPGNLPARAIVVDGASTSHGSQFMSASVRKLSPAAHQEWMVTFTVRETHVTGTLTRGDRRIHRPLPTDDQAYNVLTGKSESGLTLWLSAATDAVNVLRDEVADDQVVSVLIVHALAGEGAGDGWLADVLTWVCRPSADFASTLKSFLRTDPDHRSAWSEFSSVPTVPGLSDDVVKRVVDVAARHRPAEQ